MTENTVSQHRYKLFAVAATGTFMATLDGSIVNVALPTIARDLQCSINVVAWVVLAYTLTLVSLILVFGAWTDRRGYLFAYKFGFSFFLVGSLLCWTSWSIESLLAGRVIQAVGSAMFQAVGVGLITEVFPGKDRGKGIGLMVMMVSAGLMTGPPLGGFLVGIFPWQMIFAINIPIGLIGLAMTLRYFRRLPRRRSERPVSLSASVAISVVLLAATLGLSLVGDYGLSDVRIWALAAVVVVGLVFFYRSESRPEKALVGMELFRNRQFSTSLVAAILMFISIAGVLILIPFYLEQVRGFEPSRVGLYLMVMPLLMFMVAPLAGKLSDRIGSRILTTAGMTVLAFGLWLLSRVAVDSSGGYIIVCIVAIGTGVAIFNTPNSSAIMGSVGAGQRAITSSLISASRNIGMSTGVALSTMLFAWLQAGNSHLSDPNLIFVASYRPVVYVALGVCLAALPLCFMRKP